MEGGKEGRRLWRGGWTEDRRRIWSQSEAAEAAQYTASMLCSLICPSIADHLSSQDCIASPHALVC